MKPSDAKTGDVATRPAEPRNAAALAAVQIASALRAYRELFPADAPQPTSEVLEPRWREAAGRGDAIAAECDGILVGGVIAHAGELSRLYVHPDWWHRGVGSRLYDAALAHLRAAGAREARLWVLAGNVRARTMYERRGWRLVEGETHEVWSGVQEVRYALDLAGATGAPVDDGSALGRRLAGT